MMSVMKFKIKLFKTRYISQANQIDLIMLMIFFCLVSIVTFLISYWFTYIGILVYCFVKNFELEQAVMVIVFILFWVYILKKLD